MSLSEIEIRNVLREIRRRPVIEQEWLSLQDAAVYTGFHEATLCEYVKRGVGPKSVKFSNNARRFKRSDLDAWVRAGGPAQEAAQ